MLPLLVLCVLLLQVSADDGRQFCNNNGYLYPDSAACECFPCYTGTNCSDLQPLADCTLDLGGGNPEILHEYWEGHPALTSISSDYRNGYQAIDTTDPSTQSPLAQDLVASIQTLHQQVGNAETHGYTIVMGAGGTSLVAASVFAFARLAVEKGARSAALFVQQPYWFHYRGFASLPLGFVHWNATASGQDPNSVVEIVTFPNNPTGAFNTNQYNTSFVIHDMVYYWPSWLQSVEKASFDVMLFSLSKLTGHAGTRAGWALVKDPQVAAYMQQWIGGTALYSNGIESLYRSYRLLQAVISSQGDFFTTAQQRMQKRWSLLETLFGLSTRFSLHSRSGFFYLWLKCERAEDLPCDQVFAKANLQVHAGPDFGSTAEFVRFDLTLRDSSFSLLLKKLALLV